MTPGVSEEIGEDVAVAVALLDERVTLLVVSVLELFGAVMVTVLLARVTVFVIVEVWVRVVVPEMVSWAKATSGRRAADKTLVNCMATDLRRSGSRINPR